MEISKSTTTRTETVITLTKEDITEFLIHKGAIKYANQINSCFMRVPGGGDWSNMDLEVGSEDPIIITLNPIIL